MAGLTATRSGAVVALAELAEPDRIGAELREIEQTSPAKARALAPDRLADAAWPSWCEVLEPLGVDRDQVQDAFASMRREIWMWVHGNRLWDQVAQQLSARVLRRI